MQICDNKELHFEEVAKEKYKATRACVTMKTLDLTSFVLHSMNLIQTNLTQIKFDD